MHRVAGRIRPPRRVLDDRAEWWPSGFSLLPAWSDRQVLRAIAPYGEKAYRGVHGIEKLTRDNDQRVTLEV